MHLSSNLLKWSMIHRGWLNVCSQCCSYPGMFLYVFYSWMFNCIALIWHLRYSCVTSRCHERDNFFVQWSLNHCVPIVPSKCHFMAVLCFFFFFLSSFKKGQSHIRACWADGLSPKHKGHRDAPMFLPNNFKCHVSDVSPWLPQAVTSLLRRRCSLDSWIMSLRVTRWIQL